MKFIGIIPARYASSRFPGKPLALIHGKSMIQRVYQQALKARSLSEIIVATDDERILNHVSDFGGKALMTSQTHTTGTERCREIIEILEEKNLVFDVAINIQGDEPYIHPQQIDQLASCFENEHSEIATLVKSCSDEKELTNHNTIKVVTDVNNYALYFSRSPIPYYRNQNIENKTFYKHIGIYAYRTHILKKITELKPTPLEMAESLEQLRWIENGYKIMTCETSYESYSVDVPEDIQKLESFFPD